MKNIDPIRAWKDEAYRESLTPEELAKLPDNPAGLIELSDMDLGYAVGGASADQGQQCECSVVSPYCWTNTCTSQPGPWGCAG
ncbi:mersacidin/lichenicidin family type 2 lantibiotic [Candidatus Leptofilum sp.]|uniref:mersacidin/lichenicidin family type 2 lantibiotic n=1 Tax=Candidatus Leptofilum sp. TaxID=3241576 RepID=UPI003B5AAE46